MRHGAALVTIVMLAASAGGGCVDVHKPPDYVKYTYDPPPGYAEDEELPLGSYDGRGGKVEIGGSSDVP
jgi:hypothetical protein